MIIGADNRGPKGTIGERGPMGEPGNVLGAGIIKFTIFK